MQFIGHMSLGLTEGVALPGKCPEKLRRGPSMPKHLPAPSTPLSPGSAGRLFYSAVGQALWSQGFISDLEETFVCV